jgi:hypothetical protein
MAQKDCHSHTVEDFRAAANSHDNSIRREDETQNSQAEEVD